MPNYSREELRQIIAEQLTKAKVDPLYFFSRVKTLDTEEADPRLRVKQYPIHKAYLQNLIWLACKDRRLAVYKARRMIVTWTMCGVATHELLFQPGANIAFISKKEEDAGKLVGRVKFIYDHLPAYWKLGLPEPLYYRAKKAIYVKMVCQFPNGQPDAIMQAFPEGGDQLRMDGYTMIYWDEVGLIDDTMCRHTYAAAVPTLGSTGRFILSSTPPRYPDHFWYKLCSGEYLGQ